VLDHRVDHRIEGHPADLAHPALRIAAHRMLDLDHIRAPFGQHRAGAGHEDELRHLDDADALENLGHRKRPSRGGEELAVKRLRPCS
jgi:hypothetical protein